MGVCNGNEEKGIEEDRNQLSTWNESLMSGFQILIFHMSLFNDEEPNFIPIHEVGQGGRWCIIARGVFNFI